MCDKFLEKSREDQTVLVDESFITKKDFLLLIEDSECVQKIPTPSSIIYPKANLYYAFGEDVHPMKRIIAASKFFGKDKLLSQVVSCEEDLFANEDLDLEDKAVNCYLRIHPASFVIFGKPGLNFADVASAIAEAQNCVLISPISLIQEEIAACTDKGRYMKRILRLGKSVGSEILMTLIRRRVGMRDVRHRARRVPVPDARFDYLCEYFKPASKVPAFLHVMDIAGLVKGASEGQGLGNSFLSHIGACDGIFHLCRAFEDDDVTHVEGDVNPVRDLDIISEELRLKDVEFLNVHLEKLEKLVIRGNDKKLKPEYDTLLKVKGVLADEKKHIRFADWSANDIEVLNKYLFLTSKPIIYLVNLSEKDYIRKKNKWLIKIKEWVDKNDPGAVLIPFSGIFENKILDMDEAERAKYFEEHKVTSALDKIIVQGYKALQLQYFFTSGHDEVKAWTIQRGTKAPQAAGKIHTDFEKGFIMAEVMKFEDFKNEGSEAAVKAAGKYRQQGRNYVVEDGDIIFFKFNAGAGLKDAKKK